MSYKYDLASILSIVNTPTAILYLEGFKPQSGFEAWSVRGYQRLLAADYPVELAAKR